MREPDKFSIVVQAMAMLINLSTIIFILWAIFFSGVLRAETDTNNRLEQRFESPTLVIVEPPFADLSVSVDEIIEVLEKARLYIWNELPQSTTLEFDPCTIDPICMAQRQVERMRERKALREKIDRILKVLK